MDDFIKLETLDDFAKYLPFNYEWDSDAIVGKTVYVNQKFEKMKTRDILTASVFALDNKTTLHVKHTCRYLDYAEILADGELSGDRFSPVSFSLLTDSSNVFPVMSLYMEAVAGIFIDRSDPNHVVQVVMDKYTGVIIFHRLFSLCQQQLTSIIDVLKDMHYVEGNVECDSSEGNPFITEFNKICSLIKSVEGIDALIKEILSS